LDDQSGWLDGEHVTCIVSDVRIARASGAEGGVL
jgi:hypothetical protein